MIYEARNAFDIKFGLKVWFNKQSLDFVNYRKQTLFEIIWRILMRYPSHVCFGPARSGVNMLIN